jgi:preprotein translocase subunit SecG
MSGNDDGEGICYPRATRLILLISLIIHIAGVVYLLGHRLKSIDLHRIYEPAMGLRSSPQPGSFLAVEVIIVYGVFIAFLIWIAFSLYRGDDGQAAKIYAICALIAVLVAARYDPVIKAR